MRIEDFLPAGSAGELAQRGTAVATATSRETRRIAQGHSGHALTKREYA